ncbi:cholinesterase [Culex quinquefasciatus]|uniref:Carboxylic ester hydrolase n=1 Tax=Culex quinquefasciatus TaxID=7176 RepID=B0WIU3_CULQU|nr:cholinesterase [Culex quinquefasciatus]|eukprot:XP_001848627.1 cholinesterase [Culex quinquefasciatus]
MSNPVTLILLLLPAAISAVGMNCPATCGSTIPSVTITDGCLCGTTMPGLEGGPFDAYLGVPFAKPPVGELRFANPVRNLPWSGAYNASIARGACLQQNEFNPDRALAGDEDCLYLNVYKPRAGSGPLPVMAYIHGGGYIAGTAHPAYVGPEKFMDTGRVVLVTFQYRVGALGFLSTGDRAAPGNFGLKDQTMALKWIQENIRRFGGDPAKVTLFGQSAGASSVQLHMVSPLSAGLFAKAISASGSMLSYWNRPYEDALTLARRQGEALDISNARAISTEKLVEALRKVDAKQLVGSVDKLKFWYNQPIILYRPVVERYVSKETFLSEDPARLWASGRYRMVPWLTGFVPNEGAALTLGVVTNAVKLPQFLANQTNLLSMFAAVPKSQEKNLLKRFFAGAPVSNANIDGFDKMVTEAAFLYPMMKSILLYRASNPSASGGSVSLYHFNFAGRYRYSALYTGQPMTSRYGIVHGEDLLYLWRSPAVFPDFPRDSPEAAMSRRLVKLFVDFAYEG